MTVVLLICVVPHTGNPFVTIAADSRSSREGGVIISNKAKKIFDAGNAFMATSGNGDDAYREDIARVLRELPIRTMNEKMQALQSMFFEDNSNHDWLQINAGIVQFDEVGNPQMGIRGITLEGKCRELGPETYDKNMPDVQDLYMGATITEEVAKLRIEFHARLRSQLDAGEINEFSVENTAEWFIGEVAKIYPDTVNSVVQAKTMEFK